MAEDAIDAQLHHVGIVVPGHEQVKELLDLLGLRIGHTSYVERYDADCVFTQQAGACVEFVVPHSGALTRFNRGAGGLHHIAVQVPNIEAATEALQRRGITLLEERPVETDILRINFVPPVYTRGIIVELVETKSATASPGEGPAADASPERIAAAYPQAWAVVEEMRTAAPVFLGTPADILIRTHGEAFWAEAERLVDLALRLGGSPCTALLEYTMAYLREQAAYARTKQYSHTEYDDVRKEVYDNPEVMQGFYLEGLMLTHAFWPIHFDIHRFFAREFLPRVPNGGMGSEVGFGHGLYLHDILTARPGARTVSYDISEYSREYAGRLLREAGISPDRFQLGPADARVALPIEDQACDWMIFAEVLEHIPDPAFALRELARCLKPGAPLFTTTVVESNAIDHLYQFRDAAEVRQMLEDSGFDVAAEKILRVRDYDERSRDPTVDLAYVATRRPA